MAGDEDTTQTAAGHHGQAHRDIEKVTDFAEEVTVDNSKLQKASRSTMRDY